MIIHESYLRDFFRLLVWFPLRWAAAYLPLPVSFLLFRTMGDLMFMAARGKRGAVTSSMNTHLKDFAPEMDISRITRDYFRHHLLNTLFPFVIPRLDRKYLENNVDIQGLEHIDNALVEGNGCILIQGHVGIVQFPLYYLDFQGYNLGQIFYRHTQGLSWIGKKVQLRYREKIEERLNVKLFAVDGFQRPVMKWLKHNNVLMLNGDGIGGREFVGRYELFPFLGKRTFFPLGPYNLALRLNTPLLPTHVDFDGRDFRITIYPPLKTSETGKAALFDLARKFIGYLQGKILEKPETWHFWDSFRKGMLIPDQAADETKVNNNPEKIDKQ